MLGTEIGPSKLSSILVNGTEKKRKDSDSTTKVVNKKCFYIRIKLTKIEKV